MDGLATLRAIGPAHAMKATAHGLRDGARALTGRAPHTVPAVSPVDGPFGVMQQPGNYDGFVEIAKDSATWRNEVSGRVLLEFATYRPGRRASKVRCPVLFLAGDVDNLTPASATRRTAASAPSGRLIVLGCGHFEPYVGEVFEQNVEEQVKFLTGVLDRPAALAAT
jgi:pimeloyl-ACP methyl ester carboxylesterase